MRFPLLIAPLVIACAATPVPEANGYDVQLYFEGVPVGMTTAVGQPAELTVHRLEQQPDRCASAESGCDPTAETPIAFVAASCDALCMVTPSTPADGYVSLQAVATQAGSTTLHVTVRSQIDGSEWSDAYPLTFR